MSQEPPRPLARPPLRGRVAAWLAWFGVGRLVTSALSVVVVVAGAWWLLRTPPPPTEASLPVATTAVPAPVASTPSGTGPPASSAATLRVHVAGAVVAPGVHELPAGARVVDAVAAAGGPAADADVDATNLAAPLADGLRIYVPRVGEVVAATASPGGALDPAVTAGPIDVNAATAAELDALPGIGPATAAAIVAHREQHGPFVTVDDLLAVRGIGPAKLDAIRAEVTT